MRQHMHLHYFKIEMDSTNKNWADFWFYIENPVPKLLERTSRAPVHQAEWDNQPGAEEMKQVTALLTLVEEVKAAGINPTTVVARFCRRLVQPIKDRVHPSYEYKGPQDCTKEQFRYVRGEELRERILTVLFTIEKENMSRPPFSLANPAPLVSILLRAISCFLIHPWGAVCKS